MDIVKIHINPWKVLHFSTWKNVEGLYYFRIFEENQIDTSYVDRILKLKGLVIDLVKSQIIKPHTYGMGHDIFALEFISSSGIASLLK